MNKPSKYKPKFDEIIQPEWLAFVTYLYRDERLSDDQAAKRIGVSRATLFRWRKNSDALNRAILLGKEIADQQMENALYKSGINGNVTAQIFWLCNRKPKHWRNVRDQSGGTQENKLDEYFDKLDEAVKNGSD